MLANFHTYESTYAEVKKLANAFLGVHVLPNLQFLLRHSPLATTVKASLLHAAEPLISTVVDSIA